MRIFSIRAVGRFLCLVVLTVGLTAMGNMVQPLHRYSGALVQAREASQLVQQGVNAYRNYAYAEAVRFWESALLRYGEDDVKGDRAIILANLARAHRQMGQPSKALDYWQQVAAIYTDLRDWDHLGQALTEQAQTYGRLGQPFRAIGLLCTGNTSPSLETTDVGVISQVNATDGMAAIDCLPASAVMLARQTTNLEAEVAALGALGEAYRAIQNYTAAQQFLSEGLVRAADLADQRYQALLHNSLGHTYREEAELNYQRASAVLRSGSGGDRTFQDLSQQASRDAFGEFEVSQRLAQQTGDTAMEIKALLGLTALYAHTGSQTEVMRLRTEAISLQRQLPPDQTKAYLALQLTKRRLPLADNDGAALIPSTSASSRSQCQDIWPDANAWVLLEQANTIAEQLQNNRLKAFTKGEIGHFYECHADYDKALKWTQQARLAASGDRILAIDTLYLWQWQMGRIYKAQGADSQAIAFYSQAAASLNRIRDEILASNQTLQFDFRDTVAPVYRELAEIQLARVSPSPSFPPPTSHSPTLLLSYSSPQALPMPTAEFQMPNSSHALNIKAALGNIDNLQLAELQNYFGSGCVVPVAERRLDETLGLEHEAAQAITATALISTILFPDKTAVILTLPDQSRYLHWIDSPEMALRRTIIHFRNSLEDTSTELEGYDTRLAKQLYGEFVQPFEAQLAANDIATLLFVNDGILRNMPMAALYDGEQYLIQRFAIAIAPSLQQTTPLAGETQERRALVLGLTQNSLVNGEILPSLPAVGREVSDVVSLLPGSESLVNEALTKANLRQKLAIASYPVLHIATHGQFGTDPQATFLVLGGKAQPPTQTSTQSENQLLRLGELDTLVREGAPRKGLLDLIVLSACQTASGDERSTLGLAGVTIRAGARSALASLWAVNDEATADLIVLFYQGWQAGMTKAEALQFAQKRILNEPSYRTHPAYWSAFVLVGDWQ